MKNVFGRAILFAFEALLVSVVLDVLFWGGYQGFHPRKHINDLLVSRGFLHGGVFVAAFGGVLFSFILLRHRLPSLKTTSFLGLIFGGISLFGFVIATEVAGVIYASVALAVVAACVAGIGGFFLPAKNP